MLIHGDMVTKSGDVDLALYIYKSIQKTEDYPLWPTHFKKIVISRIANYESIISKFRIKIEGNQPTNVYETTIFNSKYACSISHQASKSNHRNLPEDYEYLLE